MRFPQNIFLFSVLFLTLFGCKKSENDAAPTNQDQLAANKWESERVSYTVTATFSGFEFPVQSQESLVDTVVIAFTKDKNLIVYNRNKTTNALTKISEQPYNLNETTQEISITALQNALLSPELRAFLVQFGVTLPGTAKITTLTSTQLVLTSVVSANVKASDLSGIVTFPIPIAPTTIIPIKVNIVTSFKKSLL